MVLGKLILLAQQVQFSNDQSTVQTASVGTGTAKVQDNYPILELLFNIYKPKLLQVSRSIDITQIVGYSQHSTALFFLNNQLEKLCEFNTIIDLGHGDICDIQKV